MKNIVQKRINIFEGLNQNKLLLTNSILIKQELNNVLFRKDVLASEVNLAQSNNNLIVSIQGFTRTSKLLKYRKLLKNYSLVNKYRKHKNLANLFTHSFKNSITKNNVLINYTNLNILIDKNLLTKNFKIFKKFHSVLFARGSNLFLDFLKVLTLVEQKKISLKAFLIILGQIFRNSNKKKHTRFVLFIKTIFDTLEHSLENSVLGLKLIINGRIMGKTRASTVKIERGSLSLNTVNSGCIFEKLHVYTLYGAFGFKLWINYKN
jgi:hypothetical protein